MLLIDKKDIFIEQIDLAKFMKLTKFNLLVVIVVTFVTKSFSQQPKHYEIYSGFALGGGITKYTIHTDNFEVTPQNGWFIKTSTTVDIPHKWYNVSYGMQISKNKLDIAGRELITSTKELPINYKTMAAQLSVLWHAKLFGGYCSVDFGPMLQYNGNLELEDRDQESFLVKGYNKVTAKDIQEISNIHIVPAVGFTAGISHFKFSVQYLYTLTNMLGKLDKKELDLEGNDINFKGNQGMITLSGMFTFN